MGDDDLVYFTVFDNNVAKDVKRPAVKLYKQFDEGENTMEEEVTDASLKTFISTNSFATVIVFDDRAIGKIF